MHARIVLFLLTASSTSGCNKQTRPLAELHCTLHCLENGECTRNNVMRAADVCAARKHDSRKLQGMDVLLSAPTNTDIYHNHKPWGFSYSRAAMVPQATVIIAARAGYRI